MFESLRFHVHYQRPGEEGKILEINPLGIVFNDPAVYLVATCWDYTDPRLYALHRMSDAKLLETPCTPPQGFDLQRYIDSGAFGFARQCGKTLRLKVLFEEKPASHLRETPLSAEQTITHRKDGRVLIEAEVADTEQLRWWLLGFGAAVEVLGPKRLREEFGKMSRKMAARYGQGGEHV
ncbi:MAG: helix-turn-helix transcriptional regulator [Desulfobulbaceae bacterium]